jgi:hypothetical protein
MPRVLRGSLQGVELRVEEFQFNLTLAGRPAGSQRLSSQFERGLYVMRLEASFQGALGSQKRLQVSKLEPESRLPTLFTENDNGRVFETSFDRQSGLVKLRQNRDEASSALTQDYQDPVSLLQFLRDLPEDARSVRVPMIGGTVLVTRLEDETVDSPFGPLPAHVYYLRPGVSLVYIEAAPSRRILKLTQSLGKYALEAQLTRVTEGQVSKDGPRQDASRRERGGDPRARRPGQSKAEAVKTEAAHRPPDSPRGDGQQRQEGQGRSRRRGRNRGGDRHEAASAPQQPRASQAPKAQAARESSSPRAEPQPPRQEAQRHSSPGEGAGDEQARRSKRRRRLRRRNGKPAEGGTE